MRADLVERRVWMGRQQVWVIKDPLSGEFFYFSDREHEILQLSDGSRSLFEIAAECTRRFAPQYIAEQSLVHFFAEARRQGLLVVPGGPPLAHSSARRGRARWWHNPLAIRLPGLNPDRFLDGILPACTPLFSLPAVVAALALALIAAMLVARDFDLFARHVAIAARLGSPSCVWILLPVMAVTKIVHELAHALACKRFGGECRELGVLLLFGVPCLYCDVSDAWLLERRWQRVAVSAAGMFAEMVIAAVATIFWVFTVDGTVRDVCVIVMVVCSVTTVLFNGNPLLRYDGYYILADLAGIPNLAGRSGAMVRDGFRWLLWATPVVRPGLTASRREMWIGVYGLISGIYRALLVWFILWMLLRLAQRFELGGVAAVLLTLAAVAAGWPWLKAIGTPPSRSLRRANLSERRPAVVVATAVLMVAAVMVIPLPRSVVAPMSIQPAGVQTVYAAGSGAIGEALPEGAEVGEGQKIAVLTNPLVDLELVRTGGLCEQLAIQLRSLQQRRSLDRELSAQIPTLEQTLAEAIQRKRLQQQLADRLVVTAPRPGRVFAPHCRAARPADQRQQQFWTGTPLEPINRGAWLEEGTVVCLVGHPTEREAIVMLPQQEVELIRPNQQVSLLLADRNRASVTGRVVEVAATETAEIPAELHRAGRIEPQRTDPQTTPYYQVRVAIDPSSPALPVRLTGHARISVHSASLLNRLRRFLGNAFG
jgi:putative peptide zinc metalloprotease protein